MACRAAYRAVLVVVAVVLGLVAVQAASQRPKHRHATPDVLAQFAGHEMVDVRLAPLAERQLRQSVVAQQNAHPDEELNHPSVARFVFEAYGNQFDLHLKKTDVIDPEYTQQRMRNGQVHSVKTRRDIVNCYYSVHVASNNATASGVSTASTCAGLKATIHAHGRVFFIRPFSSGPEVASAEPRVYSHATITTMRHVVYTMDDLPEHQKPAFKCGVGAERSNRVDAQHHDHNHDHGHAHSHTATTAANRATPARHSNGAGSASSPVETQAFSQSTAYVRIGIFNDDYRFADLGDDTEQDTFELINRVKELYAAARSGDAENVLKTGSNRDLTILFRQQITWETHQDAIDDGVAAQISNGQILVDPYLEDAVNLDMGATVAVIHILSGHDFEDNIVGYAYTWGMCRNSESVGIEQVNHYFNDDFDAATLAHELGHNLGMCHDPPAQYRNADICADLSSISSQGSECNGKIMSAFSAPNSPATRFSRCSGVDFKQYLDNADNIYNTVCLNDPLDYDEFSIGPAVCGNGRREDGEDCDCNNTTDCANMPAPYTDACCGDNCVFITDATCSERDSCCDADTCTIIAKSAKHVCRAKDPNNECDLVERCEGDRTCPADEYLGDGFDCADELAAQNKSFLEKYWLEIVIAAGALAALFIVYKCLCSTVKCCCGEGEKAKKKRSKKKKGGKKRSAVSPSASHAGAAAAGAPSLPPNWQVRYTAEGIPIYINTLTGERYDFRAGAAGAGPGAPPQPADMSVQHYGGQQAQPYGHFSQPQAPAYQSQQAAPAYQSQAPAYQPQLAYSQPQAQPAGSGPAMY